MTKTVLRRLSIGATARPPPPLSVDDDDESFASEEQVASEVPAAWAAQYRRLQAFHRAHSHSNVPQRYPPDKALGAWVSRQRSIKGRRTLSTLQVELLDRLNFAWEVQSERFDRVWDEKFKLLAEYRIVHGHCRVPQGEVFRGCRLGWWVANQRMLRKREALRADRRQRLEALGFAWVAGDEQDGCGAAWGEDRDTGRLEAHWTHLYNELLDFRCDYGHSVVPNLFVRGKSWPLGRWVRAQRSNFRQGTLSTERRQLLEEAGFVWKVAKSSPDDDDPVDRKRWEELFRRLCQYRQDRGAAYEGVPSEYPPDQQLASWAQEQRRRISDGTLHPRRIDKLDAVGFGVPAARWESAWDRQCERLAAYRKRHGTTIVRHREEGRLAKWIAAQRWLARHGLLLAGHRRRLDALGFAWNQPREDAAGNGGGSRRRVHLVDSDEEGTTERSAEEHSDVSDN